LSPVSFFQPAYAWGLLALAVPVIVHLLGRRRTRRLDFSTLRFFRETALRAHRTRRLKRLLLLCCRLAILSVVVLIFLQPFDKNDPFAALVNPNASLYVWVDPTKSMDYVERGSPLWRRAMALVDSLDKKAPFSLRRLWYDEQQDKFALKKTLHEHRALFTRHGQPHLRNMLNAFNDGAVHSSRQAILVIFSDFQENVGRALDSFFLADSTKSLVMCVSCAPQRPNNAGIGKVTTSRERPFIVESALHAQGMERRAAVSVSFGDLRVGRETVAFRGNGAVTVKMEIAGQSGPGGCVRLETDDPFQLDNIRYFVLGEGGRRRVVIVGDSTQSYPIAAALRAIGESQWSPVILRTPGDLSMSDIDSADMVVLNEVPFVPRPITILRTARFFAPKAIIVSPAIDSQSFAVAVSLLGVQAAGTGPRPIRPDKPSGLVLYDTISMLGKGFRSLFDQDAAVARYIDRLPGSVLWALDNRKPFATHMLDSLGNSWAFFAAPMGRTASNNLCETGMYVPMVDRIARYALESIHKENDEWIAGRPRRNPFLGSRHPAIIYAAQNERCSQWGNQPYVAFDEPGLYRIQPYDRPSFWIAVNVDAEETALAYRSPKASDRSNGRIVVMGADAFLSGLSAGKGGLFSYGPWMLLAALLFVELFLWERGGDGSGEKTQRKA
jgi:hypothetical protein